MAQAGQNLASQEAAHTQLAAAARGNAQCARDPVRPSARGGGRGAREPARRGAARHRRRGLPASLLGRRPDLRAAEQRLRGALANVDATRTGFYPALSLTGSLGTSSTALGQLLRNPVATLGAGLALPFLQWNTARLTGGGVAEPVRGSGGGLRQALYTALSEVENALSSRTQLRDESEAGGGAGAGAARRAAVGGARYRAGATALQPVLDAKDRRRAAEVSLAQNRVNQLNATMTLYKALGGGAVE